MKASFSHLLGKGVLKFIIVGCLLVFITEPQICLGQTVPYMTLRHRAKQKPTYINTGDSIQLVWLNKQIKGRVSGIADSLIHVNSIPYAFGEISSLTVLRDGYARKVAQSAPRAIMKFGGLLFVYGHLNQYIQDETLIKKNHYNTLILMITAAVALPIHLGMKLTEKKVYQTDKDLIRVINFE